MPQGGAGDGHMAWPAGEESRAAPAPQCRASGSRPRGTRQMRSPQDGREAASNRDQLQPTATNRDQPRPTAAKCNQPRPTATKSDQKRPNATKRDQTRPSDTCGRLVAARAFGAFPAGPRWVRRLLPATKTSWAGNDRPPCVRCVASLGVPAHATLAGSRAFTKSLACVGRSAVPPFAIRSYACPPYQRSPCSCDPPIMEHAHWQRVFYQA